MAVRHAKVSTVPPSADEDDVRMDDWNDDHVGDTSRIATRIVAASGAHQSSKDGADYICDGVDDHVQIQAALDALPAGGGRVALSEGTYTLGAQIGRAINNVEISGGGRATLLNLNGSTPVIDVGGQTDWTVSNLATDAGGIDLTGVPTGGQFISDIWKAGVREQRFSVASTSPAGKSLYVPSGSAIIRYLTVGRFAGGGLVGLGLGNSAHLGFFSDDFATLAAHFDMSDSGAGWIEKLGLAIFGGSIHSAILCTPSSTPHVLAMRALTQVQIPRRSADPSLARDSGTATGGGTGSLTDTGKSWATDEWQYFHIKIRPNIGNMEVRVVDSNNPVTQNFPALAVPVSAGDTYEVAEVFKGDMWFDTVLNKVKVFDGTTIQTLPWE